MIRRLRSLLFGLLLLGIQSNAQPPAFIPTPLLCDTVDSAFVFQQAPLINVKYPNLVSYASVDGAVLAFKMANSNLWLTTLLPFQEPTNMFEPIHIDGVPNTCWVIDGSTLAYGSSSGTGIHSLMVVQLDTEPICLFMADYACWEEDFGDKTNGGAGAYARNYGYDLKFIDGLLQIKKLKPNHAEWCSLTPLHSGIYHWTEKGFRIPVEQVKSGKVKSKKGVGRSKKNKVKSKKGAVGSRLVAHKKHPKKSRHKHRR